MPDPYRVTRLVQFAETDSAGIAHFSAFFLYMEQAEHALLRELGLSVFHKDDEGVISWPRVSAKCDYTGAVKFEDELVIEVALERIGGSSVTYGFEFLHDGERVATGMLTAVCCRLTPGESPRSIPIPEAIRKQLSRFARPDA